jgi:hypothetical protein
MVVSTQRAQGFTKRKVAPPMSIDCQLSSAKGSVVLIKPGAMKQVNNLILENLFSCGDSDKRLHIAGGKSLQQVC